MDVSRRSPSRFRQVAATASALLLLLAVGCKKEPDADRTLTDAGPAPTSDTSVAQTAGDPVDKTPKPAAEPVAAVLGTYGHEYPTANYVDAPDPLASPIATQGGEFTLYMFQEPESYNYYLDNFYHTAVIFGMMYDSLLSGDPLTQEDAPSICNKWAISEDKLTFTFWIDPNAKWSDGSAITSADVAATYDAIMASDKTMVHRVSLSRFTTPKIIDDRTFQFTAKEVHWSNLDTIGGIQPLPKSMLTSKGLDNILFDFPLTSGPYVVKSRNTGQSLVMEKRRNWWQGNYKRNANTMNFDSLRFRFYQDTQNAMEAFKKGDLDLFTVNTSRMWIEETTGEKFDKNWIVKQRVFNAAPSGFQGWAINMRRAKFKDRRVRLALWHTVNRELMNKQYAFGVYTQHQSFFEDLYDAEHPNPNPYVTFDLDKARALFREAGWLVNPDNGKLEKNGEQFSIKVLTRDSGGDRYWNQWRQDLEKVGITLVTEQRDLSTWTKAMDEFDFDVSWSAFGSGVKKDPEHMWSSEYAHKPSSNNYTGFENAAVDALINKQKPIFDINIRNDILREIDALIYAEVPYMLLWYTNNKRILYWNKFGTPPWVLSKYGNELSAITYWWDDPDAAAELEDAMADGAALPDKPDDVHFDTVFTQ